jgi:hypothetical protein
MENRVDDITQVSDKENDIFTTMFSEEKVKEAIFQMENNKAPLSFMFPIGIEFYISSVLGRHKKANLMAIFWDFYKGDLPSLNLGTITLLTKCQEAI